MARLDHVTQIGNPGRDPEIYLEDYVYTFLKRQGDEDRKKYYLYGEREGSKNIEKLYIYGISDSAKEERTYFREFQFLGILKTRNGEKLLTGRGCQDTPVTGFYIFYASNHSMQEYLVDTSIGDKGEKGLNRMGGGQKAGQKAGQEARQKPEKGRTVREKYVLTRKADFSNLVFYAGCILALLLLVTAVTGGNGYGKLLAFREMVRQTMAGRTNTAELVIEEQKAGEDSLYPSRDSANSVNKEDAWEEETAEDSVQESTQDSTQDSAQNSTQNSTQNNTQNSLQETMGGTVEAAALTTNPVETKEEENYEVYIVKEGDSLAGICKRQYGNTDKIKEICLYNNIENEDHISPGQKIYLPR